MSQSVNPEPGATLATRLAFPTGPWGLGPRVPGTLFLLYLDQKYLDIMISRKLFDNVKHIVTCGIIFLITFKSQI